MFLVDHQIALVQASFVPVIDNLDAAVALFYDCLFELDPSLENLFRNDMRDQGRKFIHTLFTLVDVLDNPTEFIATAEVLGNSYVRYGVKEEDYGLLGQALHGLLQQGLGDDYSLEVEEAWATAYEVIASIAISAAYPAVVDSW